MSRTFFRNAAFIAAAEMLARVKGFATIPLLTVRLGPAGYGVWAQVATLAVLLGPLIMLGTDAGIVRYLPGTERRERSARFAAWMLAVSAATIVVCGIVAVLRHPLAIAVFGSAGAYARFIPLAAASIAAAIVLNLGRTWYRLENEAIRLSGVTLAQALLSLVALVVWYVLHKGVYELVEYSVAADAVLAVAVLVHVARAMGRILPDFSLLGRLTRYGVALLPAGYAVWVLNWADRLFLVHYADLRAVGIYSLAYSLGYLIVQVVVNPIWTMFPNAFAEEWNLGRRADAQRLFESTAGVILALTAPVITGGIVLGGTLLNALAPASFARAGLVLPLVLGGYLCFMLAAFYEVALGMVDRQGIGAATVGAACGFNLLLNFLLIPRYSYMGAAVATCAAFALELAICIVLARRFRTLRTPWRMPVRIACAALGVLVVLAPFRRVLVGHDVIRLLLGAAIGAAVYGTLCLLLGVVHRQTLSTELRRVRARLRSRPAQA